MFEPGTKNIRYKDQGLVVIGVHTPEFAFEKNIDNVKTAVERNGFAVGGGGIA
jgi:hypothetical protein